MTSLTTLVALAALASTGDAVLVQFASESCQPCREMQPAVSRLIGDGYPVQRIDVDQHAETARQFGVRAVPTFVLLVGGREVGRVEGATSYDRLAGMFQALQPSDRATPAPPTQTALQPTEFRSSASPDQAALAASVRLKVEDATGFGFGTGTIIDTHDDEALVVTCGHLFRESQGKGRILVDLFAPGATQPVEGQVIAYDLDRDIALVSIRPGMAVTPASVAPAGHAVRPRDRVFTVGCDKGADATVRQSEITSVDKYQGKPNFTAAGAPIDGRSGGGLFTAEGLLIGICNAADPQDDEGLYAGLASIHWQLDQIGASAVYQRSAGPAQIADAGPPPTAAPASFNQYEQPSEQPRADLTSLPQLPAQMPGQMPAQATLPTAAT
ncbi:MAG: trypsin-like peptidase domain-containing protein, partial [Pirellulaceae bacterium]